MTQIRTDLALEAQENMAKMQGDFRGVRVEECQVKAADVKITKVVVETKNGAKSLGKPMGTYITLETPFLTDGDRGVQEELSKILAEQIRQLMPRDAQSVLVVGLGNRAITADSLGSHVVDHLQVNRHLLLEYGDAALEGQQMQMMSALTPGVMAKTGMETGEIVAGVLAQTSPDYVLVIDALAARSLRRLNRTIQLADSGIQPGSGVGNHRCALSQETLGVPVIAMGVPTVMDAAAVVNDPLANGMYVTSKDVDSQIEQIAHILSTSINVAVAK